MGKRRNLRKMDFLPVWTDYNTWKQDYADATAYEQEKLQSDTASFKAQAAALGYDTSSDYYTRGLAGITEASQKRTAQTEQDWADVQSGITMEILRGEGDAAAIIPTFKGREFNLYGTYLRDFYEPELELEVYETNRDWDGMGSGYTQEQIERQRARTEAQMQDKFSFSAAPYHGIKPIFHESRAEGPIGMEEYYTRVLGAPTLDPMREVNKAKEAGEKAAEQAAGQSALRGGADFEGVVQIEEEEEEEAAGWWS